VSSLALPAFLASVAGTALLQTEILANCNVPEDPYWKNYLQLWSASGIEMPDPFPLKQSSWDRPGIEKDPASQNRVFARRFSEQCLMQQRQITVETGYGSFQSHHMA